MATKPHTRRIAAVLLIACLGSTMGCSAYDARYAYQPKPSVTMIQFGDDPDTAPLRMLSSIIGIRRPTKEAGNRSFVEAAILFDNTSLETIAFDPATAALFAGDVQRFPDPDLVSQEKITIEPGHTARVMLLFAFPHTEPKTPIDLNGLNLRWAIQHNGQSYYQSATFDRRSPQRYRHDGYYPGYYDRYYAGYPGPYDHYFYHRHFRH